MVTDVPLGFDMIHEKMGLTLNAVPNKIPRATPFGATLAKGIKYSPPTPSNPKFCFWEQAHHKIK